jgi:hypothetical protein
MRTDPAAVRAEILQNREKMFAARRAREAAGVLPDELNDRIRGFQESRAVLTALELDLFTAVGDGAGATEVAARLHTDPRATEMLLNVLVALRLLVKQDGVFRNSPLPRVLHRRFARQCPAGLAAHRAPVAPWSTLTDCVRAGTSVAQGEIVDRGGTGPKPSSPPCTATPRNARRWWCARWARRTSAACSTWAAGRALTRLHSPRPTPHCAPIFWTWPRSSPSRGATSRRLVWRTASRSAPAICVPIGWATW